MPIVLAVPRHRLGDEIVTDLSAHGIAGRVYRGRESVDPEAPGEKMCRDLDRAELLNGAVASISLKGCKHGAAECEFYRDCGYQRQQRRTPQVWIVPHQLLFLERPDFIPQPGSLAIDEAFWNASLHGTDRPYLLWLDDLEKYRAVFYPSSSSLRCDVRASNDLLVISQRVAHLLWKEPDGCLRRSSLVEAGITLAELNTALRLEWRRKIEPQVEPGMPLPVVRERCRGIIEHNQMVARLARFWRLLTDTLEATEVERSPWLDFQKAVRGSSGRGQAPAVSMVWRDDIHPSWAAPTLVMDATMPVAIVRQFFPNLEPPIHIDAPMPHTRVRQITDRPMTAQMLIPNATAGDKSQHAQNANVERVHRLLEVRAREMSPGKVLVVCQKGLEASLMAGTQAGRYLPPNVELAHFNAITGLNAWQDVALVIVIGRTEPSPRTVERIARAIFRADVVEIEPDSAGEIKYPLVTRGIRLRDGRGIAVRGPQHPDESVEIVRWAICEAELVQAIGRGRGIRRTEANPLAIDIITNIVLPIEVDELTTWDDIQPTLAKVMWARGAVPMSFGDMAASYPDLFPSRDAAQKALNRENPGQTSIESYLLDVCPGFQSITYRRAGARGPAGTLLYDAIRIDPVAWFAQHLGDVSVLA
jgi:putative DNA primase/helicase